jgi:hypothetical protein
VRTSLGDLRADVQDLRAGQERLAQRIGVLHEETLDKIAALAPDDKPIRRDFAKADAELREDINRRLEPLETWAKTKGARLPNRRPPR